MGDYETALSAMARVKRADIREGKAHRGRTARGTWIVQTVHGPVLELTPGRAHLNLDGERAAATAALRKDLETERLSLLRHLAGTPNEMPKAEPGILRARQMEVASLAELQEARDARRATAWERAIEADRRATEASEALARADLADPSAVRALQKERVKTEQRREAAWYDATVQSLVLAESATVAERADLPDIRLRM